MWRIGAELAAGILLLYCGAELLVKGGVAVAVRLGIPPLIVGLTLVSFATSAPELVVSIQAALEGNGAISVGNVVGSNICNLGLILGLSSVIAPLEVSRRLRIVDAPQMIALTALFAGIGFFAHRFDRLAGVLFLALLALSLRANIRSARRNGEAPPPEVCSGARSLPAALLMTAGGVAALTGGAHLLVEGATALGKLAGISDAVIGLTIVAVGTSLPELATSVIAAIRREQEIALGNIVGSNILNILVIMGISPLIRPVSATGITGVDWAVLLGTALLLYPMMLPKRIPRAGGLLFLLVFIGYMAWLVYSSAAG